MTEAAGVKYPAQMFSAKPRIEDVRGRTAFTLGGADLRFELKKSGYLDGLIIRVDGTYEVTTASLVLLPRAPWSILSAKLKPQGRMQFLDSVSLYSLRLHDYFTRGISPFVYGAPDVRTSGLDSHTGRSALIESFPLTVATQTFELWFWVAARRSATDPRGRIPLHNDSDTVLYLTPNTEANMVTVPGNWAQAGGLNATVWQVTYDEVPLSDRIEPFDSSWTIVVEEHEDVAAVGWNEVNIDPDGSIILGIGHTLALNDVQTTSDDIESIDFKVDKTYIVEPDTDPRAYYFWQKRTVGVPPIDGVLYYDFDQFADTDGAAKMDGEQYEPSLGRPLNTANAKIIKSRIKIPTGTTLGSTPRIHTTIRKLVKVGR